MKIIFKTYKTVQTVTYPFFVKWRDERRNELVVLRMTNVTEWKTVPCSFLGKLKKPKTIEYKRFFAYTDREAQELFEGIISNAYDFDTPIPVIIKVEG